MVIDSMLDRIKAESTIDIFNFVAYLRTRRTAMVQTEVRDVFNHFIMLNQMPSSKNVSIKMAVSRVNLVYFILSFQILTMKLNVREETTFIGLKNKPMFSRANLTLETFELNSFSKTDIHICLVILSYCASVPFIVFYFCCILHCCVIVNFPSVFQMVIFIFQSDGVPCWLTQFL